MPQKRVLIKLSGELLAAEQDLQQLLQQLQDLLASKHQIALVVGGGNYMRGKSVPQQQSLRTSYDAMGMLGTVLNGLALQIQLEQYCGTNTTKLYCAFALGQLVPAYNRALALADLAGGKIVIFVGGIGSPYFSTDTVAVLRSLEMQCDLLIKLTKVNGVYTADPAIHQDAQAYQTINFDEMLKHKLAVIDMAAVALCREHQVALHVCSLASNLHNVLLYGEGGTNASHNAITSFGAASGECT